jgi:hypothetical protein
MKRSDRKRRPWRARRTAGTLVLGIAPLMGCDGGTSPELATVVVLVADEPSEMLETAEVWISRIYLQGSEDAQEEGNGGSATGQGAASDGRVDLFDAEGDPGARKVLDLLTLRDGATADATGEVPVEAGVYHQLRFVVDSTWVVLKDGYTFEDGTTEQGFKVPSGGQSGIKVQLIDGALEAGAGETVTITVDFPVDDNFVIQQTRDPDVIRRILFTPSLKEMERMTERS